MTLLLRSLWLNFQPFTSSWRNFTSHSALQKRHQSHTAIIHQIFLTVCLWFYGIKVIDQKYSQHGYKFDSKLMRWHAMELAMWSKLFWYNKNLRNKNSLLSNMCTLYNIHALYTVYSVQCFQGTPHFSRYSSMFLHVSNATVQFVCLTLCVFIEKMLN